MSALCVEPVTVDPSFLAYKGLLDQELWDRLVKRIIKVEGLHRSLAERILNQALAFLLLCAKEPNGAFSPSPLVDVGWHTFILYTKPYADFCDKVCGRFLHHTPSDVEGVDYGTGDVARTAAALRSHGFVVDEPLWVSNRQNCTNDGDCTSGDGCEVVPASEITQRV
jgi:hypothetical protein